MKTKVCTKCKVEKKINEFYYKKSTRLLDSQCKECTKLKVKRYQETLDPEYRKVLQRKRYLLNRDHHKAICADYKKKHRKHYLDLNRELRKKYKEEGYFSALHYKHKYNKTLEDKKEVYDRQNGLCCVCGTKLPNKYTEARTIFNPIKEEILGLSCIGCCLSLGLLKYSKKNASKIKDLAFLE
jgi:hypothetical protein